MMIDGIDNGVPAFPVHDTALIGMTHRDYFAAAALQGLLASGRASQTSFVIVSSQAVLLADCLMQVLRTQPSLPENATIEFVERVKAAIEAAQ